jgi:hypothetical protein
MIEVFSHAPNKVIVLIGLEKPAAVERLWKEMDIPCKRHGIYINLKQLLLVFLKVFDKSHLIVTEDWQGFAVVLLVELFDALVQKARQKAVKGSLRNTLFYCAVVSVPVSYSSQWYLHDRCYYSWPSIKEIAIVLFRYFRGHTFEALALGTGEYAMSRTSHCLILLYLSAWFETTMATFAHLVPSGSFPNNKDARNIF